MRTTKLIALAAGAILWAGLTPLAAQEAAAGEAKGFSFRVDSLSLGNEGIDDGITSARFFEYRDIEDGALGFVDLGGESDDGERFFGFTASRVGRDDARYTLGYGAVGKYRLDIDYNQIVHRFGYDGRQLWNRTAPGRFEIPDAMQAAFQSSLTANRSRLTFPTLLPFMTNLLSPHLADANVVDVGLGRDRLLARFDLGRTAAFNWGVEYSREKRDGTRPFGGSFGFNNVTELPEPIDYTTQDAELAGEWNGKRGGLRFGYRLSSFKNDVSTLIWDNPFRITDSTDPSAYQSPGTGSVGGAVLGMADLAPDNEAGQFFLNGRARAGTWAFTASAAMINMTQDDPFLPYTLNTAIQGINFDHSTFDPTHPANLPARRADNEVDVMTFTGQAGTDLGESFDLTFRYRYYDYDNKSRRIAFPGYVRYHGVWEEIGRVSVPYAYTRQDASAEFGWDLGTRSRLALSYGLQLWDREFREVDGSDEDILRLSFDTRPFDKLALRARYETGDRAIDHYEVEAMEASFIEHGEPNNIPALRRFDEAARQYDDYNLQAQWFATNAWNVTFGVSSRNEDFDESEFGLVSDEILQYNAEVAFAPGENLNFFLFGHQADREVFQKARQSGATPSPREIDTWMVRFDEANYTYGLGFNTRFAKRFTFDLSARQVESDGGADFTAFAGGLPLGSPGAGLPPRTNAQDFDNYEDIDLTSVLAKLGYDFRNRYTLSLSYLWEDYGINSFILQDLQSVLPGALLLNGNIGDYRGEAFRIEVSTTF